MDERQAAFFEDLAETIDSCVESLVSALDDPTTASAWSERLPELQVVATGLASSEQREALVAVVRESLVIAIHSTPVAVDGGTEFASTHGSPQLLDRDGRSLGDGLHELFIEHLHDTGREA